MSLFVCDRCHVVENTALGLHSSRSIAGGKSLCSECVHEAVNEGLLPDWLDEHGGWHGQFPRQVATLEILRTRAKEFVGSAGQVDLVPGISLPDAP